MLKAGIIGLGWWGRIITALLSDSSRIKLVAAADVDPAAGKFASAHGLSFTPDTNSLLVSSAIDSVILCTPHTLHCDQIIRAAAAGKHVFCEKPLSLTRADAARAVAACNGAGVVLGVGHERRFEPPTVDLRKAVETGELGTLLQIEANFSQDKFLSLPADNWRLSERDAPAGPMTATGIHLLDLGVSFLGRPASVLARVATLGSKLPNGDTLAAMVSFETGANLMISAILATPFEGRFAVYGTRGWIEIRDKSHPENPTGWTVIRQIGGKAREIVDYPARSGVKVNLEAFAAAALGEAAYPMPQQQMIDNIAALEAIFKSAKTGGIVPAERSTPSGG
jgi:predicted dehydrogenase